MTTTVPAASAGSTHRTAPAEREEGERRARRGRAAPRSAERARPRRRSGAQSGRERRSTAASGRGRPSASEGGPARPEDVARTSATRASAGPRRRSRATRRGPGEVAAAEEREHERPGEHDGASEEKSGVAHGRASRRRTPRALLCAALMGPRLIPLGLAAASYRARARPAAGHRRRRHEGRPLRRSRRRSSPTSPRRGRRRASSGTSSAASTAATCSRWRRGSRSATRSGIPEWVVHRLWLGTLFALAAWGVVRLLDELARPPARRAARRGRGPLRPQPVRRGLREPHQRVAARLRGAAVAAARDPPRPARSRGPGAGRRCSRSSSRAPAAGSTRR